MGNRRKYGQAKDSARKCKDNKETSQGIPSNSSRLREYSTLRYIVVPEQPEYGWQSRILESAESETDICFLQERVAWSLNEKIAIFSFLVLLIC